MKQRKKRGDRKCRACVIAGIEAQAHTVLQTKNEAQLLLAFCYMNGQGVPQDYKAAVRYYRLAGDQGNVIAQLSLAVLYREGKGVRQDFQEAIRWFRLAADQGNACAQYSLAVLYHNGRGVTRDLQEAIRWYRLAADLGNMYA
jgi:TPR repeat protein